MRFIPYRARNLRGVFLYVPEEASKPVPLVIWLTGGNGESQYPLHNSLGKLLKEGKILPECAVLIPATSGGQNYTAMTGNQLAELVILAGEYVSLNYENISICGWGLGALAAGTLVEDSPALFDRACFISNIPDIWDAHELDIPVLFLIGGSEQSADRDWLSILESTPTASLLIAENYGHEIGEQIWANEGAWLFRWLTAEGGRRCYQTLR